MLSFCAILPLQTRGMQSLSRTLPQIAQRLTCDGLPTVALTWEFDADSAVHAAYADNVDDDVVTLSLMRYDPEIAIQGIVDLFGCCPLRRTCCSVSDG
jgi:hypothetical protein